MNDGNIEDDEIIRVQLYVFDQKIIEAHKFHKDIFEGNGKDDMAISESNGKEDGNKLVEGYELARLHWKEEKSLIDIT